MLNRAFGPVNGFVVCGFGVCVRACVCIGVEEAEKRYNLGEGSV